MISSCATRSLKPEGRNFSTQGRLSASCSGCAAGVTVGAALPLLWGWLEIGGERETR